MSGWNKLFASLAGWLVTLTSGTDPILYELFPMLPVWVGGAVGTILVGMFPNGRPFWQVNKPSV
jgi:hypothetical protein